MVNAKLEAAWRVKKASKIQNKYFSKLEPSYILGWVCKFVLRCIYILDRISPSVETLNWHTIQISDFEMITVSTKNKREPNTNPYSNQKSLLSIHIQIKFVNSYSNQNLCCCLLHNVHLIVVNGAQHCTVSEILDVHPCKI